MSTEDREYAVWHTLEPPVRTRENSEVSHPILNSGVVLTECLGQ